MNKINHFFLHAFLSFPSSKRFFFSLHSLKIHLRLSLLVIIFHSISPFEERQHIPLLQAIQNCITFTLRNTENWFLSRCKFTLIRLLRDNVLSLHSHTYILIYLRCSFIEEASKAESANLHMKLSPTIKQFRQLTSQKNRLKYANENSLLLLPPMKVPFL